MARTAKLVRIPDHPLAPSSGILPLARVLLYEELGPGLHPCQWCMNLVGWNQITVGRMDGNRRNDHPSNLFVCCKACSAARTHPPIGYGEPTVAWAGSRTRAVPRACENCGSGFFAVPAQIRAGKGRFCSRSCARQQPRTDVRG